jgi:hypothetical protein
VRHFLTRYLVVLLLLAAFAHSTRCRQSPAVTQLTAVESNYADLIDAHYVLQTIDSGLFTTYQGKDRAAWSDVYQSKRKEEAASLATMSAEKLSAADARAISIMRKNLAGLPEASSASSSLQPSGHCSDAQQKNIDSAKLRDALYACFEEIGNNLQFENAHLTRVGAFELLSTISDPARRKMLFLALQPLWQSINAHNEPDSPYRRRIRVAAADAAKHGSPIDAAARTLGARPADVESWLEQILDAWRQSAGDQLIEPWDYYFVNGQANRVLASAIPRDSLLPIAEQYYQDLGANLKQLGVLYDLDPRPGKAPLAYMDFVTVGRQINSTWRPTVVRISATYSGGGLSLLNEFVHENGHAVHGAAVRNRPAFMDMGDELFVEAFADVASWDTFDAAWQQKYLGRSASQSDSLRSQYSGVMLDAAWSLFELRMLRNPSDDPNAVWTGITSRYLHMVPHPEWSWWAVRVQLDDPGYMVNYGLGAVVTADIRQRIRESIGSFNTGNPLWYPWMSENLLRFGMERETSDLLRTFLGRPVSPQALIDDIHRVASPRDKPTPPPAPKS